MRYPISKLNKKILKPLVHELKHNGYHVPKTVKLFPATSYCYYVKGSPGRIGFVFEINFKADKNVPVKINYGSWNGDYRAKIVTGLVNSDKTEHEITSIQAICKGYLDEKNYPSIEIYMLPGNMPKEIPEIKLSNRERRIMYIIGNLSSKSEREMALSRCSVSAKEIAGLVKKDALIFNNKGQLNLTLSGEAARLDSITNDELW